MQAIIGRRDWCRALTKKVDKKLKYFVKITEIVAGTLRAFRIIVMTTMIILATSLGVLFTVEYVSAVQAPIGYEDETGFHFGPDARDRNELDDLSHSAAGRGLTAQPSLSRPPQLRGVISA